VTIIDGCPMTVIAQEHRPLEIVATEAPKPNATVAARAEVLLGLISGSYP